MDDKQIEGIQSILTEWNPLGEKASEVHDLNNYKTEAIDILFHIDKKSSIDRINKIMTRVISEAFGVYHELEDTRQYAEKIRRTFKTK
ncbi:MAG: hypothetical protein KJ754_07520 [Bacteroidetes bacterium]|nr:hypothetical protein [Bacteroidota bacterium]MBU1579262.1 hypothetical protein [Bacteroidota bacterium]MBU2465858.1 hypothetical protein [Bacteroidota bacterium]